MKNYPAGFIPKVQQAVAITAIGPSALRNQGAPGVIDAARAYLSQLDLGQFQVRSVDEFRTTLDSVTAALTRAFPENAQNWGAARKAINLFLRDALYNRYLSDQFDMPSLETWLEIPLDSVIAKKLREADEQGELPVWPGLKALDPTTSSRFQEFASGCALSEGVARVHLDIYLWPEGR